MVCRITRNRAPPRKENMVRSSRNGLGTRPMSAPERTGPPDGCRPLLPLGYTGPILSHPFLRRRNGIAKTQTHLKIASLAAPPGCGRRFKFRGLLIKASAAARAARLPAPHIMICLQPFQVRSGESCLRLGHRTEQDPGPAAPLRVHPSPPLASSWHHDDPISLRLGAHPGYPSRF